MGKQYKDNTVDLSEKWETLPILAPKSLTSLTGSEGVVSLILSVTTGPRFIRNTMLSITNGDTLTDLTIKNGMVYIKRVQKTYWKKSGLIYSEKSYDTPVTIYRVMPVSEFSVLRPVRV